MSEVKALKQLDFIGSSREDLKEFPEEARQDIGYAFFEVQKGLKPTAAKPLKGFGGIDLIQRRLKAAEEDYNDYYKRGE